MTGSGNRHAIAAASLAGAALLSFVAVRFGPAAGEALLGAIPGAADNAPLAETLFNLAIFLPMALVAIGAARLCGVNAVAMGVRPGGGIALGAAIGLAGVLAATGYAWLAGALTMGSLSAAGALLVWGLAVVTVQAGAEEIVFRGWLQPVLARAWGAAPAVAIGALAFAGLHVLGGARTPLSLLNLALGGVMFGLLALRRGGLAAALGAHVAWNAAEQLLLGLDPNPGAGSFGTAVDLELAGAALWGGSEEGLNASLGMSFALAAIVVPLLILVRRGDARGDSAAAAPIAAAAT